MQRVSFRPIVAVASGAVLGALSRYCLGLQISQLLGQAFPYATFLINVTGCFLMGIISNLPTTRSMPIHPDLRRLLTTGFLGSYTTFSSYELETAQLLSKNLEAAFLYWAGSCVAGLLSLWLGVRFSQIWADRSADRS